MPFGTSNPAEHYHLLSSEMSLVSSLSNNQPLDRLCVSTYTHPSSKGRILTLRIHFYYRELKYNFLPRLLFEMFTRY